MSLAAGQDGTPAGQVQGRPKGKKEDLRRNQAHLKRRLCWSLKLSPLHSSSLSTFLGERLGSLAARKTFWPRFRQPIKNRSPSGSWRLLEAVWIGEPELMLGKGLMVLPAPGKQRGLPSVKDTVSASPHAHPALSAQPCQLLSHNLRRFAGDVSSLAEMSQTKQAV